MVTGLTSYVNRKEGPYSDFSLDIWSQVAYYCELMAFGSVSRPFDTSTLASHKPISNYIPNAGLVKLWPIFQRSPIYLTLTPSQQGFAKLFFEGRNLCLSGAAGVGKSYLINALFIFLQEQKVSAARTATTGVAAFNVGGQTIHSWAGLGLADEDAESIIEKVRKKSKVKERIKATTILFIDEVSMCKADLLDKLNLVMQAIRYSIAPFGGVQIIASADFLQLAPIWKGDEHKAFAFDARSWKDATIQTFILKEVVRQSDNDFIHLLNAIRIGDTSNLSLLKSRIDATFPQDGIEPVRIFCKNVDVERVNKERLDQIPSPVKIFIAKDSGMPHHIDAFNKNCPASEKLELKLGAQVMLLANLDTEAGFVNGSIGLVTAFGPQGITVKFKHGTIIIDHHVWEMKEQEVGMDHRIRYKVVASRTQIPLKCCWSVTTHKAQGSTLDRAIIDMNEAFSSGMVYVALSRVRDLESLSIVDFPTSAIQVNQQCLDFYKNLDKTI